MAILASVFLVLGWALLVIGAVWFLVVAFQHSIVWGLLCLFLPILQIVFLIITWPKAAKPFLVYIAGAICVGVAAGLAMTGAAATGAHP